MLGVVLSTSDLESEDKDKNPLVGQKQVLLHVTDGTRNIRPTVPYRERFVMVWGFNSYDCKLDFITIQYNLMAMGTSTMCWNHH